MDLYQLLTFLQGLSPYATYVLMALGSLVVIASIYVKLTPNPKDDEFLAQLEAKPFIGDLLRALVRFSVVARVEKKEEKK